MLKCIVTSVSALLEKVKLYFFNRRNIVSALMITYNNTLIFMNYNLMRILCLYLIAFPA